MSSRLSNPIAREYLSQGVSRRLKVLERCICNIYCLFPPEKRNLLTKNELTDLSINLHAFFVNISGILDNLAWVFVYEKNLYGSAKVGKLGKYDVGLFNKKTLKYLWPKLSDYLKTESMGNWYKEYSKNYRDALAHRIPLYVPPSALNEKEGEKYAQIEEQLQLLDMGNPEELTRYEQLREEQSDLGRPCVLFAHSFREKCKQVYFHAQVIADFMTVKEIIDRFCKELLENNIDSREKQKDC